LLPSSSLPEACTSMHWSRNLALIAFMASPARVASTQRTPIPRQELYSPLIAPKVHAVALTDPTPFDYPEYTDRTQGIWRYFMPTTWTSGFLPALLYLLDTRTTLCPSPNQPDWLALARNWSLGLVPLEDDKSLDHDVGFLSYPFQQELLVYVRSNYLTSIGTAQMDEPQESWECLCSDSYHQICFNSGWKI
jgi:hypothetical protein